MVKHQPLQVYERQLCLSCLTGIYGCRWKRYQRSHDDTTKWERMWFLILSCTFFLLLVWFYFWWEAHNDYNEFNWFLYNRSGDWSDGSVPILAATAAGFMYIVFLMVLALCHVAVGQQLNLHWLHKIGVTAVLVTTVIAVMSVEQLWREEWDIVLISLQAKGPFLHIGALAVMTVLAWLVAGQFARSEKTGFQAVLLLVYACALLALYLVPLAITSPCLMERSSLSPRPEVIGRRGAPMLAPENTLMSFRKALQQKVRGWEVDVTISLDGVPFLMRDRTLRRTTNVEWVFPERQFEDAAMFNWTDLQALNAGQWFLKDDPFWTAHQLSQKDLAQADNQSVCSLRELLQLAARNNRSVLLTLRRPPEEHPFHDGWINATLDTVLQSGIQQELVMWTPHTDRQLVRRMAPGLQQTSAVKASVEALRQEGIVKLSLRYNQASPREIRAFSASNISLNLFTVNEPWLFSVLWCSGVPSVSSDAPHILKKVPYPIWLMTPDEYCLVWITSDLVSFSLIIGIFVLQKWRLGSIRSYNPEQIMLSAAVRRSSRDVNIMKEKLIFSEINNGVGSAEELSLCGDHGYDGYANEAITPFDQPSLKMHVH